MAGNARSPPDGVSFLGQGPRDEGAEDGLNGFIQQGQGLARPLQPYNQPLPSNAQDKGQGHGREHIPSLDSSRFPRSTSNATSQSAQRAQQQSPYAYARQQREGYGFRPRSGQSTPSGVEHDSPTMLSFANASQSSHHTAAAAAGVGSGSASGAGVGFTRDDDEVDHIPDRRTVEQLREGVRDELVRHENGHGQGPGDLGQGGMIVQGRGIADAEGLGWPGESRRSGSVDPLASCHLAVYPRLVIFESDTLWWIGRTTLRRSQIHCRTPDSRYPR